MLLELTIRDFALIERMKVEFGPGLNVLIVFLKAFDIAYTASEKFGREVYFFACFQDAVLQSSGNDYSNSVYRKNSVTGKSRSSGVFSF